MPWLGGNKENKNRKKQIKGLSKVTGAQSLTKDQSKWKVAFSTRNGRVELFIDLSQQFPQQPPKLYLKNQRHMLCDTYGNVIITKILLSGKWDPSRDTLESLVKKVVHQMTASPPYHPPQQNRYNQNNFNNNNFNNNNFSNFNQNQNQNRNLSNPQNFNRQESSDELTISVPNNIFELPKIKDLTEDEMEQLLNDTDGLKDVAYLASENYREMKNSTASGVLQEAQMNIKKKEEIDKLVESNEKIREEVETLQQIFKKLVEKHGSLSSKFSDEKVIRQLEDEMDKTDKEVEDLREKFEEEEISHVKFIKQYHAIRTRYHLLNVKRERLEAMKLQIGWQAET